jgi:hypothetical protein
LNNGNSFRSISNQNGNDTAYELHICAQSDVNLDTEIPIFEYEKLNQKQSLMGHELTSNIYCQETLNDEDGCSIRDRISKTSTLLSSPSIIVSPYCTVNKIKYILTPSWEQEAKIHHTVHAEVILSGINCNPIMYSVPDNTTTVLKNLVDISERKLSLTDIQTDPLKCDRFQVDIHTLEGEVMFDLQMSEASIHRKALLLNTVDIWQSMSDVFPDYLQCILIKADTNISSRSKFLENCISAINIQYVPNSGSCKTHTVPKISNISGVSASENFRMQSEGCGMQALGLDVVNNYHSNLIQDRLCKIIREIDFSVPQRRISLQTVDALWSALPIIIRTPLYISHLNYFNTTYSWQKTDKNQILETYSTLSRSSHIQNVSIKNNNSDTFQKHSSPLVDCVCFNESSRQISLLEIMKLFRDRKIICEDGISLQSSVVLQKDTVRAESGVSASSEQDSLHSDRNKPSNIIMQMKLMGADSVYDSCDCARDSSDTTVNGFIVKGQKIRSLSQPSLPTYLLHGSSDDEQFSENSDDESDCLSETFREYEDFYQENISEFLAAKGKGKHIEIPYNAVNVVHHETTDPDQNVYTLQSDHLYNTAVTEFKRDNTFTELYNKSQKLRVKGDKLSFHEGRKMPYPVSPEMDTCNKDLVFPFGNIQDTNIFEGDDRNIPQTESDITQNIIAVEDDVSDREYPSSDKQHLFIPLPHSQIFGEHKVTIAENVQCNVCNLPDIADSWNSSGYKTCLEEAETRMLSVCSSNFARGANIRCKVCRVTWASDTKGYKIQNEITTTQTHEACEKICHFTVAHSRTGNRCEPCTVRGNICRPECITVKESQTFTRPVPSNIMCSNGNYISYQHVPNQNNTVFPSSHPEPVSNSCKNGCDQKQPVSFPCVENCHSHNQILQVHTKSRGNTLNSCTEISVKKYETDVPRQSCSTDVKPTEDVAVQTNIRSLIGLENEKGCFVCFSNNHFNVNGSRTGTHRNLASKRNFEALDLESVPLHKKPRYDASKLIYFESYIPELPANLNSKSEKSETTDGSCPDNGNEESDFQNVEHLDELQDTSVMDRQNSVDSDQKVPDVGKDISWMEDDMNEKELYVRDEIMKGKLIILLINIVTNLPFSLSPLTY